ncbi:hypothetical protein AMST5_03052 [freshwater sediment metagenome]|uniref:Uncharacterized protein n=1 Tax=freshwater sediment metagenome TaxID=556182 RepID=A0AA48M4K8_9ZZZZ
MAPKSPHSKSPKPKPRPISDTKTKPYRPNDIPERRIGVFPSDEPVKEGWHPEEREHHRVERRYWQTTAVLTFFAVAGAIATVLISNWTLEETRKATFEAHRQAEQAIRQANIASETEQKQLRAYIYVDKVVYGMVSNGEIETKIFVKNGGLTPASHIEIINKNIFLPFPFTGGDVPVRFGDSPVSMRLFGNTKDSFSIGPGGEKGFGDKAPIDRKMLENFERKKFAHVFYGAVYYDDVFGSPHFSKYCFYFLSRKAENGMICKDGNESN